MKRISGMVCENVNLIWTVMIGAKEKMNTLAHYVKCVCRFPIYFFGGLIRLSNWRELVSATLCMGVGRPSAIRELRLRNGLKLSVPATHADQAVYEFKEIWLTGVYTRKYGLRLEEYNTVLDVGASFGSFAFLAAQAAPRATVYAFEPDPRQAECFTCNLRSNDHVRNIVFHNAFLCGTAQSVDASIFPSASVLTVTEFLQGVKETGKVLVKVDIEGGEYDLLMNSPSLLASRPTMVGEWHIFSGQSQHPERLWLFLRQHGFSVEVEGQGTGGYFCARPDAP